MRDMLDKHFDKILIAGVTLVFLSAELILSLCGKADLAAKVDGSVLYLVGVISGLCTGQLLKKQNEVPNG